MVGRRTNAAISEVNGVMAALARGAVEGLEERLGLAIRTFSAEGAELHGAFARAHVATVRYAAGDLKGARQSLAEALPPLRKSRYLRGLILAVTERAHLDAVAGSLESARQGLEEAKRLADLAEDPVSRLTATCLTCHVGCFLGDRAGAIAAARAALAAARRIDEFPPRCEAVLWLSEAVAYGLPWSEVQEAGALLSDAGAAAADLLLVPIAVFRAVATLADAQGDAGPLEEAAATLRGEHVGKRRAALRVLASVLEVEAARRRRDGPQAAAIADSGIAAAAALGHVWLEARLRAPRAELPGGSAHRDRLRDLLVRVSEGLAPGERPLLVDAWTR
jgi:hypothetical protein